MNLAASNLLMLSAQIAIVVIAGAALIRFTPLRAPRSAYFCWRLLLALCVCLPLLSPRMPAPDTPVVAARAITAARAVSAPGIAWEFWAFGVLAAGCAVFVLRLLASLWRVSGVLRRSRPLPGCGGEFRLSDDILGPVTCGWRRAVVLVPPSYLEMPPEQQAAIRAHEMAHVRGRHWLQMLAEELVRAVYWFHPAVWFVLSRIHVTREQAVDAEVIQLTGDRESYLSALLAVAGLRGEPDWSPAPTFLRRRHLAERIESIVHPAGVSRWAVLAVLPGLAAACALAVTVAPMRLPPAAALQIRVGGNRQSAKLVHRLRPAYPAAAKQARIQGPVQLSVVIGRDGRVKSIEPVAGHPDLIASAVAAVREWQYESTLLNGKPVEVITRVDVNFTLTK